MTDIYVNNLGCLTSVAGWIPVLFATGRDTKLKIGHQIIRSKHWESENEVS